MPTGDLSMDPGVLHAEIVEYEAEIARRIAALAKLAIAGRGQVPEATIDLPELARREGATQKALRARLDRPAWAWLRDLGDRRRDGRGRRWLWSEVVAARVARSGA